MKRAQSLFGKDKAGAQILSTGANLSRPTRDDQFILWRRNNFWNEITGLKGIPYGSIVQISGRPDSGKSSMANIFMAEAQDQGTIVILVDAEQKFQQKRYDEYMGGDSSKLLTIRSNSIVDIARAVAYYVRSINDTNKDAKILLVIDSIGVLNNRSESDEDNEDMSKQPGQAAKEVGFLIKKINRLISDSQNRTTGDHNLAVLVINQVYSQLMTPGLKERGGEQLFYMTSLLLQLTRKKDLNKVKLGKKIKHGIVSRARIKKNHLFDGIETTSELDIVVSADGVALADEVKKKDSEVQGWDDPESDME